MNIFAIEIKFSSYLPTLNFVSLLPETKHYFCLALSDPFLNIGVK